MSGHEDISDSLSFSLLFAVIIGIQGTVIILSSISFSENLQCRIYSSIQLKGNLVGIEDQLNHDPVSDSELTQATRRTFILEACKNWTVDEVYMNHATRQGQSLMIRNFQYQDGRKNVDNATTLYTCIPFKTGTKSWLGFGEAYSKTSKRVGDTSVRRQQILLNPDVSQSIMRILNVRHPFDRLVSAYEDKFVKNYKRHRDYWAPGKNGTSMKFGIPLESIKRGYRPQMPKEVMEIWVAAFWYHAEQMFKFDSERVSDRVNTGHLVKFKTFIDYIANGDGLKIKTHFTSLQETGLQHWLPQFDYCQPCIVNYDVVTHVETLDDDMTYIRQRTNSTFENVYANANQKPRSKEQRAAVAQYYRDNGIDRQLLLQLYARYKMDFLAFGYDFNVFLRAYDSHN